MKIILNHDVQNLGEEGDVREVARGYARNYLFRKGLAVPYNKENVAVFEHKKSAIEKRKEEKRTAAAGVKAQIEALKLEMTMPAGTTGRLFGSVTAASLAEELEKNGVVVEKKKIDIPGNTIKMTGDYTFTVRLYAEESAQCSVSIQSDKKPASTAAAEKATGKAAVETAEEEAEEETLDETGEEIVDETPEAAEEDVAEETVEETAVEEDAGETVEETAVEEDAEETVEETSVEEDAEETEAEPAGEEAVEETDAQPAETDETVEEASDEETPDEDENAEEDQD